MSKRKSNRPYILTASWFHSSSLYRDELRMVFEVDGGNLKYHVMKGGDWRVHPEGEIEAWLDEQGFRETKQLEGPTNYPTMSVCHIRNRDMGLAFRMRFT